MSGKADTAIYKKLYFRLPIYLLAAVIFAMPARTALEQHFLYFPAKAHEATPHAVGLDFEDISFHAGDGTRLNGWLVPGNTGAPVVLFCMGNAGNISHRLETLQLLNELGVSVLIFDYRGYGRSDGKADEKGLYLDVIAAFELLEKRGWRADRIIIFGRSLGAAIGLEAALQKNPAGLVMESAFTSIAAMGRFHYPLLNLLLGWMIDADFDNLEKISNLKNPVLLMHGDQDRICPPRMAEDLYQAAPEDKSIQWIVGADHNNGFVVGGQRYRTVLRTSIRKWTGFDDQRGT